MRTARISMSLTIFYVNCLYFDGHMSKLLTLIKIHAHTMYPKLVVQPEQSNQSKVSLCALFIEFVFSIYHVIQIIIYFYYFQMHISCHCMPFMFAVCVHFVRVPLFQAQSNIVLQFSFKSLLNFFFFSFYFSIISLLLLLLFLFPFVCNTCGVAVLRACKKCD